MRAFILVLVGLVASVSAAPAVNGEVVSTCNDKTDLGVISCSGTGFITCTHRGNVFKPCAVGTACAPEGDSIVCAAVS